MDYDEQFEQWDSLLVDTDDLINDDELIATGGCGNG